jgi:hypothetical protein
MICRVMPEISEASPPSRCWSAALNQFQQCEGFAADDCAG